MSLRTKRGYRDVKNFSNVSKGGDLPRHVSFDEHDSKCNNDTNTNTTKDSSKNTTRLLEEALWSLPHKKKKRSNMHALVHHDLQHHACDDDDVKALLQDAMWYLSEEFRTNYHE